MPLRPFCQSIKLSTAMSLIDRLPKSVAIDVLSTWVDLVSLTSYDAAICNRKARSEYVSTIADPHFSSVGIDLSTASLLFDKMITDMALGPSWVPLFLAWLRKRNLRLSRLRINGGMLGQTEIFAEESNKGNHLQELLIDCTRLPGQPLWTSPICFDYRTHTMLLRLQVLQLQNFENLDASVTSWRNFAPNLKSLILRKCAVSDALLSTFLASCTRLQEVFLWECNALTGSCLVDHFHAHPSLTALAADRCAIFHPQHIFTLIECSPKLSSFQMSYSEDLGPSGITTLLTLLRQRKQLSFLKLERFFFSVDHFFLLLYCLNALHTLDLGVAVFPDDQVLQSLSLPWPQHLPHLTYLDLSNSRGLTDSIAMGLIGCSEKLKVLRISHCSLLTDNTLHCLADHCFYLQEMNISQCVLSSVALEHVVKNCHNLRALAVFQLGGQDSVTNTVLSLLGEHCHGLTSLNISYAKHDLRQGLLDLIAGCCGLKILDLLGCSGIDDSVLIALALHCPRITSLDIAYCHAVSDAGLADLALHSKHLRILDATFCGNLTDRGVAHFVNTSSSLKTIIVSACGKISEYVYTFITDDNKRNKLEY